MKDTKNIFIREVYLEAEPGSDLRNCKVDAILFSAENRVNVVMTHNDRQWSIRYNDLNEIIDKIIKQI